MSITPERPHAFAHTLSQGGRKTGNARPPERCGQCLFFVVCQEAIMFQVIRVGRVIMCVGHGVAGWEWECESSKVK